MPSPTDYISLEQAIAYIKRESPDALTEIARAINDQRPDVQFQPSVIISSKHGHSIPGFNFTYGQFGSYLDLAVRKHVSVLVETGAGTVQAEHVFINRSWLLEQYKLATSQPSVIQALKLRSYQAGGATVTPIQPPLQDQTPADSRIELAKLKIRLERHTMLRPDDERDKEIAQLREQLATANAERNKFADEQATLELTIKLLSTENDALRKERAPTTGAQKAPKDTARKQSNVETFNEEQRATRNAVAEYARALWSHPDFSETRTMEMVHLIRRACETVPMGNLPATDARLAIWLSQDAAPPFAKRRGRPSGKKTKK